MNDAPTATPPRPRTRVARPAGLLLVAGGWLLAVAARGDEPAKSPPPRPVLDLADGGTVPGELAESGKSGAIGWKADAFAAPFEFPQEEVRAIRFPVGARASKAAGALGFELSGGDVVYGSLVGLDGESAELEVARLGRVRVDRARIRRIFRWQDGAALLHDGPNGLLGWKEVFPIKPRLDRAGRAAAVGAFQINNAPNGPPPAIPKPAPAGPGWVEDGLLLRSTRDGATIQADVGLPLRASIELELAWYQGADFTLALGVSDDEKSAARAFRLEVWNGQIVAVRETDKAVDFAAIRRVDNDPGRVRLQMFLDQGLGRLAIFSEYGDPLADLKLGEGAGEPLPGIRLTNVRGETVLERLRVARWDGETPRPSGDAGSRIRMVDGSIFRGQVERFDATSREFVAKRGTFERKVGEDQVEDISFSGPADDAPRAVRVAYQDGTQIVGDWAGFEGGRMVLASPGFAAPLRLPQEGLRSVEVARRDVKPRERDDRIGELEVDGLRILGHLADSGGKTGEGPLAWQPLAGGPPGAIRAGTAARVVYKRTPPRPAPAPATTAAQRRAIDLQRNAAFGNNGLFGNQAQPQAPDRLMPPIRRSLYLRSGDIVPVIVAKIDEKGVWFRTPFSEGGFVPNDRVKAVELAPEMSPPLRVNKAKLERLLTLPRMQKESPPTHLVRSINGDILRGRVTGMDDQTLAVEVRLEEKRVPRDRVSRIIWLHADEADPAKKPAEPRAAEPSPPARVQAVRSDGVRLTFVAERCAEGVLSGKSEMLGPCNVRVQDLDQLLIGGLVEKEAAQLAYQNFRLQDAPEPKSAQADADGGGGGAAGTESALVGKPAPDFKLDLLGGKSFQLAEAKGRIVVLDFWASWCGPCIQAMPQIDRVTREFADKGVQLIAVNLQETPAQITAMLERQKLSPTVALDRDGVVAGKYGANAIPQTVVIDREGKVTRLFIGGGPQFEGQLREALQSLMPPK